MNKKGFTLIEILVVIALLGMIITLVVPKVVDIFSKTSDKSLKIQENEISDAALLYLDDYCLNPIPGNSCTLTKKEENGKYEGEIELKTLINNGYIEEVYYNDVLCKGTIIILDNKATTSLICGE